MSPTTAVKRLTGFVSDSFSIAIEDGTRTTDAGYRVWGPAGGVSNRAEVPELAVAYRLSLTFFKLNSQARHFLTKRSEFRECNVVYLVYLRANSSRFDT
jgi:hypothetical protein